MGNGLQWRFRQPEKVRADGCVQRGCRLVRKERLHGSRPSSRGSRAADGRCGAAWCNGVQGATATSANTAAMAVWSL